MASGKWYFEMQVISGGNYVAGVATGAATNASGQFGAYATGYGYVDNGTKVNNGTATAYGGTMSANDIIGVAFDADAGSLTFYKNGVSQGVAFSSMPSATYFPAMSCASSVMVANFGQRAFSYTAPSGYQALCTQNLSTPTIANGANYFNISLSNTGTTSGPGAGVAKVISGLAFQPDMVWSKNRSSSSNARWGVIDSVRGVNKTIATNLTNAEVTSQTDLLTSFNSDGVNIGADAGGYGWNWNQQSGASDNYAYWLWKAGGSSSSNTSGSITSTVSVNTTAGFSVATFTTQSSSTGTFGHGLGVAPSMVILKLRAISNDWNVYHTSIGATKYLYLDTAAAAGTSTAVWNDTAPTSSVVTLGTSWAGSYTAVAYCFAAIAGYSAFGSYTGNGSSDGPFVYCGFRPRWVMIKNTTSGAGYDWEVYDTSRGTYNLDNQVLYPDLSNAESTPAAAGLDILSNGFKIRFAGGNNNPSGATMIYAAFAENPFKYALAR
jgi:hypothetical protein